MSNYILTITENKLTYKIEAKIDNEIIYNKTIMIFKKTQALKALKEAKKSIEQRIPTSKQDLSKNFDKWMKQLDI